MLVTPHRQHGLAHRATSCVHTHCNRPFVPAAEEGLCACCAPCRQAVLGGGVDAALLPAPAAAPSAQHSPHVAQATAAVQQRPNNRAQMVAPLLRALAALHARRVMHRDIKPENIFLTHTMALKLGDLVRPAAPSGDARAVRPWLCQKKKKKKLGGLVGRCIHMPHGCYGRLGCQGCSQYAEHRAPCRGLAASWVTRHAHCRGTGESRGPSTVHLAVHARGQQ